VRYAIPTLFLILAFLVLQSLFSKAQQMSPDKEAVSFLADIQSGNASKVVRHFGTNVCHCPKKKGWGAYLAYQTDEEPNLAFLLGHPFSIVHINKRAIASSPQARHGVPWEAPEDYLVNVQIGFDKSKYSPYFVPLAMAYGKTMTNEELDNFLAHPEYEFWKSFSLRLRSGLETDAIKFDTGNIDQDVTAEFKFLGPKAEELKDKQTSKQISKEIGKEKSWYLAPKDAGAIIMPSGTIIKAGQISNKLPRLISTVIQLKVVRSAKMQPWSIAEFALKYPVLEKSNGQFVKLLER
jgi:hypothetical protein